MTTLASVMQKVDGRCLALLFTCLWIHEQITYTTRPIMIQLLSVLMQDGRAGPAAARGRGVFRHRLNPPSYSGDLFGKLAHLFLARVVYLAVYVSG